jgi:NAD(P)H-hydrate repair Nnr-like enzyme with NAD(P)H-hydrate dehydratase domain
VAGLPVTDDGGLGGAAVSAASELVEAADAVLVGPGMTGPDAAKEFVMGLLPAVPREATIVLDALALTCCPLETLLADRPRDRVVVTPNATETEMLLGRAGSGDGDDTAQRLAELLGVVVATGSTVAAPDGRVWRGREGNSGLGTSGSGDVLAGAVVGLAARAAPPPQAAVWAVDLHTAAGNRLASRVGPVGYLARELLDELPQVLAQLS